MTNKKSPQEAGQSEDAVLGFQEGVIKRYLSSSSWRGTAGQVGQHVNSYDVEVDEIDPGDFYGLGIA